MVSSDFGKLEVNRHLISGEDCAMAGEATVAAAAAPAAETFKKSRRFILGHLLVGGVSRGPAAFFRRHESRVQPKRLGWGPLTRNFRYENATMASLSLFQTKVACRSARTDRPRSRGRNGSLQLGAYLAGDGAISR